MTRSDTVYVELVDRAGNVHSRTCIDSLPARIGRGYDNTIVLDDPYVASTHVVIQRRASDDVLVARDAGTKNGIHDASVRRRSLWPRPTQPQAEIVLTPETVVRAGHTNFRVRQADYRVEPERRDTSSHTREGPASAFAAFAAVLAVALLDTWARASTHQSAAAYGRDVALYLGIVVTWAGIWALLNRLFAGRVGFGRHLLIASLAFVCLFTLTEVIEQMGFSFSLGGLVRYMDYPELTLIAAAVYFHVRTIRPLSMHLARNCAVGFSVLMMGFLAVSRYSNTESLAQSSYMGTLRWPATRAGGAIPSDAFVKVTAGLKSPVDARRNDPPPADKVDDD